MNENQEIKDDKYAAQMRLAFTRSVLLFPRIVNRDPIALAVYFIFRDVFSKLNRNSDGSQKVEFDPFDPWTTETMSALVDQAAAELISKKVPLDVTRGLPVLEAKRIAALVVGLDRAGAQTLISYAKNGGPNVPARRTTMLRIRRNLLANNLAGDAARTARVHYASAGQNAEPSTV